MKKTFDCVEMKRKGAELVYQETKDMTVEEELAYWKKHSDVLRREIERAKKRKIQEVAQ